jgi:hypothetical protein
MKAEFPIPAEFPPGARFFVDNAEPVVWLPAEGFCAISGSGLLIPLPEGEFARNSPPSEIKEPEWRERADREIAWMRAELASSAAP